VQEKSGQEFLWKQKLKPVWHFFSEEYKKQEKCTV